MTAAAKKVPPLPTVTSAASAALLLLLIAGSQIGYREGRSKSGEPNNDTVYGVWYGLNFNSWCAMFVSWCANLAGFTEIIPRHAYTPSGFNWFASRGLADGRKPPNKVGVAATGKGKPRVGDVMYVYNSGLGRISHVGFVEKVLPGGYVQTIEGNTDPGGSAQGNGVYRLKRQVTSRLFFCHPQYAAVVPKQAPPAKPPVNVTPGGDITPPKDEDFFDMATKQEVKEAFAEVLESALGAKALDAKLSPVIAKYVTGDNRHDGQAEAYFAVGHAYATIRLQEELAKDGVTAQDAMQTVFQEVWNFQAPLWATPAPAKK